MLAKFCSALFALAVLTGVLAAQPAPKPADDKKLVTKVYDIKKLLGERGKASGIADADAIIKTIFDANLIHDLKPGTDGPLIVERDGGTLEVRATAKVQEEIKDLLDAIARLQDVAVDVKAEVIELDAGTYEKLVKVLPKEKAKEPVLFAVGEEVEWGNAAAIEKAFAAANKVLKTGRVVQTSGGRFVNGIETILSARHAVVTYHPAEDEAKKPLGRLQYVKDGFTLNALPIVSADRRFVRFKLTEQSTIFNGLKAREFRGFGDTFMERRISPDISDGGATGSAVVTDGGTAIFRFAYAPKEKVWVVVLKPTIFIQAEEDELKKQEKK